MHSKSHRQKLPSFLVVQPVVFGCSRLMLLRCVPCAWSAIVRCTKLSLTRGCRVCAWSLTQQPEELAAVDYVAPPYLAGGLCASIVTHVSSTPPSCSVPSDQAWSSGVLVWCRRSLVVRVHAPVPSIRHSSSCVHGIAGARHQRSAVGELRCRVEGGWRLGRCECCCRGRTLGRRRDGEVPVRGDVQGCWR